MSFYNGILNHDDNQAGNKKYADTRVSSKLDKSGDRMLGDLDMNNNAITNIKTPVNDSDATTKQYVDHHLIQSAHPLKNVFEYIMNDVNQTTSEYGIIVDKIDNLAVSFHSYNKRVIYLKLLKDGNNYRSRIGYNIYKLVDKSKDRYYTAVIEWFTTDNNAWNKMQIYHNITSGSIVSNQTKKFENGSGVYYTRSIVQIKVLSITTPPIYLLSTIHIDGVNPTYPAKFSEVYNIIYGINGSHIAVDPIVYDNNTASTKFMITGVFNKTVNNKLTLFNMYHEFLVPFNCKITNTIIKIVEPNNVFEPINIIINNTIGRGTNTQIQKYDLSNNPVVLIEGNVCHCKCLNTQAQVLQTVNKALVTLVYELI